MVDPAAAVLRVAAIDRAELDDLLAGYGLAIADVPADAPIPGSFWGDPEAGLIGDTLHLRADTPVHSALHEACHWICMDTTRRAALHTDAGGTHDEENAVCYLQILLADALSGFGRARALADMDAWGYSFRLGSAQAWFLSDSDDARQWLSRRGLLPAPTPTTSVPLSAVREPHGGGPPQPVAG